MQSIIDLERSDRLIRQLRGCWLHFGCGQSIRQLLDLINFLPYNISSFSSLPPCPNVWFLFLSIGWTFSYWLHSSSILRYQCLLYRCSIWSYFLLIFGQPPLRVCWSPPLRLPTFLLMSQKKSCRHFLCRIFLRPISIHCVCHLLRPSLICFQGPRRGAWLGHQVSSSTWSAFSNWLSARNS